MCAAPGEADHVVYLFLAARTQTTCALNARIQIDGDRRMRNVASRLLPGREPRFTDLELFRPLVEFRRQRVLRLDDVARLTASVAKVRPFIVTRDWRPTRALESAHLRAQLARPPTQGDLFA